MNQEPPGSSGQPYFDRPARDKNQQRGASSRPRGFRGRRNNGPRHGFGSKNQPPSRQQTSVAVALPDDVDNLMENFTINDEKISTNTGNEQPNQIASTNQPPVSHDGFRGGGRGSRRIRATNYIPTSNNESNEKNDNPGTTNFSQNPRFSRGRYRNHRNVADNYYNQSVIPQPSLLPNQENIQTEESKDQSETAERQLKTNNFECMICCDNITRFNPIWCCSNCYNIFHLKCAIEWCNKSIKSRNEAITNAQYPSLNQAPSLSSNTTTNLFNNRAATSEGYADYQDERMNSIEWPCPACRELLFSRPGKYKCFCGKVIRPDINKHLTPHSCGQLCGRKRPNIECPHNCNSICHPGRCAPCLLTSKRSCHCGKLDKDVKCSIGSFACDDICDKPLSCGSHLCSKKCHEGSCATCDEIIIIKCHCGNQETPKLCSEYNKLINAGNKELAKIMKCGKICGKLLDCGRHYCNEKCHPGPNCNSCKFLSQNIKTCPCGSTLIKKSLLAGRKSCTDPMPTCENKCNRSLICGTEKNRHKCQKKCHIGPCPPCKLKTTAFCECNLSTKTIDCSLMYEKIENQEGHIQFKQVEYTFTCEARCNKLKNCGRHRCNNKCCEAIKTSNSILHKCSQICNKRLPCGMHNCPEVCHPGQCGDCTNIGWEELTCHCGGSILYPPIPCGAKAPACHRLCRRAHNCGHPVKHECHDNNENCAPCIVFVKKSCFCGSDSKDSVYCYLPGYSCGRTCKKLLACRQHRCQRVCHDNECETPNDKGIILCQQPCPVLRYSCKHPCALPCHGKIPCPTSDCRKPLEVSCECGNKVERLECYKAMRDFENRSMLAMLSTTRSNQETIMVDLSKKLPPRSSLETNDESQLKKLECDETCSVLKRNKALAEALELTQPDLKPTSIFGDDPLRLLKEATAQDYKFVSATFNSLARFVKSAKESERRFIFMQFPPAEKLRREVVHELAYHFNCTSDSDGEEPFRHVVVRAYKNKSSVPDFSIEQLLPVTV